MLLCHRTGGIHFMLSAEVIVIAVPTPTYAELFFLLDVQLLDDPLKKQQELNRQYPRKIDPARILIWFRKEAGLKPKAPL